MRWVRKTTRLLGLDGWPRVRKVVVGVIGMTVVLLGICLLVLPGPASLVIPRGLIILASEFAWARYVLRRGKSFLDKARWRKNRNSASEAPEEPEA